MGEYLGNAAWVGPVSSYRRAALPKASGGQPGGGSSLTLTVPTADACAPVFVVWAMGERAGRSVASRVGERYGPLSLLFAARSTAAMRRLGSSRTSDRAAWARVALPTLTPVSRRVFSHSSDRAAETPAER